MQLSFTADWDVSQNVFVLLVAPKGAGKEEIADYDLQKKLMKSRRKVKKKKASGDSAEEQEDEEVDEIEEELEVLEDQPGGEGSAERFMFHSKTRLADQITPEALILSLYHGSGNLVIKADEFKVR